MGYLGGRGGRQWPGGLDRADSPPGEGEQLLPFAVCVGRRVGGWVGG